MIELTHICNSHQEIQNYNPASTPDWQTVQVFGNQSANNMYYMKNFLIVVKPVFVYNEYSQTRITQDIT